MRVLSESVGFSRKMDGFGVSVLVMNTRMISACRCKKKPRKSFYGNARLLPFVLGLFWF